MIQEEVIPLKTLAPIVLFVYNRPCHTQQTIQALQKNELASKSDLFIYSDGAKLGAEEKVKEVRAYLKTITGFKSLSIIERDKNWGLANNIIDGVTYIVNQYEKIIVLEDDLVTSPYFLKFMNEALELYQKEEKVASIHGYVYPIDNLPETFFIKGADCWGWGTWQDRWMIFENDGKKLLKELLKNNLQKEADFNNNYPYTKMLRDQIAGKNNSWAIRWYFSAFLKNKLTLYPGISYVQNIGFGKDASHCTEKTDSFIIKNLNKNFSIKKIMPVENEFAKKNMEIFFSSLKKSFFKRLIKKVKGLIS